MKLKSKALFIVTLFLAQMYAVAHSYAEPLRIETESLAHQSYRPVSLPSKDRLTLVSVVQVTIGRGVLGRIAAYDDAATARPADYLELYDNLGALVAVGWFDRFGIERLAVDRALTEDSVKLEGVFVLVINGESI